MGVRSGPDLFVIGTGMGKLVDLALQSSSF